jgi:hypothetical protein
LPESKIEDWKGALEFLKLKKQEEFPKTIPKFTKLVEPKMDALMQKYGFHKGDMGFSGALKGKVGYIRKVESGTQFVSPLYEKKMGRTNIRIYIYIYIVSLFKLSMRVRDYLWKSVTSTRTELLDFLSTIGMTKEGL